ncbi:MAG: tRNA (adenosine(37)-N6)-threonylcarbamoyltransferase complex dimerization subunit type 1 TsaB [Gammaproteobacteria bacterium]|nr:tRNA (adenosine(37)-N6)-threonylcarbamoyltransferase complex dimerization subunit type 1 TsaB [Gammaproteobacteria bacterium]MCW5583231.1 tRNA (adenosine(37)-N6)-threonylcarbamoyltransferase complex dimerization subunit type 1 TsaB [Gammaproteobacteria bacterium]
MKILAIDTSTAACAIAIQNEENIKLFDKVAPMQQAKLILPAIQTLLDSVSLTLTQLDAIAYGQGPGSFTGARIASSVAQGIGFAVNKPVIPLSSLAIMAQSAFIEHQCAKLMVAIDARMAQTYWALYEAVYDEHVKLVSQEIICTPENIDIPEGQDWYGVGDGWKSYQETFIKRLGFKPVTAYPSQFPTALAVLQLAKLSFSRGEWVNASEATPIYLR